MGGRRLACRQDTETSDTELLKGNNSNAVLHFIHRVAFEPAQCRVVDKHNALGFESQDNHGVGSPDGRRHPSSGASSKAFGSLAQLPQPSNHHDILHQAHLANWIPGWAVAESRCSQNSSPRTDGKIHEYEKIRKEMITYLGIRGTLRNIVELVGLGKAFAQVLRGGLRYCPRMSLAITLMLVGAKSFHLLAPIRPCVAHLDVV
jgi:hypothetical protein